MMQRVATWAEAEFKVTGGNRGNPVVLDLMRQCFHAGSYAAFDIEGNEADIRK